MVNFFKSKKQIVVKIGLGLSMLGLVLNFQNCGRMDAILSSTSDASSPASPLALSAGNWFSNGPDLIPEIIQGGQSASNQQISTHMKTDGSFVIPVLNTAPSLVTNKFQTHEAAQVLDYEVVGYEITAPFLPNVDELYKHEGNNYPTSQIAIDNLSRDGVMIYSEIENSCNGYSEYANDIITKDEASALNIELTDAQILRNYATVASCSYIRYSSKPYLIPQLVIDSDICSNKLGSEYRMVTAADMSAFDTEFYEEMQKLLPLATNSYDWSTFYMSLATFIRSSDGGLAIGSLYPGATNRISQISYGSPENSKHHFEGAIGIDKGIYSSASNTVTLRCVKEIRVAKKDLPTMGFGGTVLNVDPGTSTLTIAVRLSEVTSSLVNAKVRVTVTYLTEDITKEVDPVTVSEEIPLTTVDLSIEPGSQTTDVAIPFETNCAGQASAAIFKLYIAEAKKVNVYESEPTVVTATYPFYTQPAPMTLNGVFLRPSPWPYGFNCVH